jgi:lipoprotein signal peptidase
MTDSTPEQASSARWHWPSHVRLWLFAALGLAADLYTKHLAFTRLSLDSNDPSGVIIKNVMSFRRSLNPGALFGLGKGLVPIFICASVLALLFVLYLFVHSARSRRSLHIALGLVLAGALGNLFDRTFVMADVVKVQALSGQTSYHAGTIIDETPYAITIVEGLLSPPVAGHAPYPEDTVSKKLVVAQRRQGVVRDFIRMEPVVAGYRIWPWVFNLADAWLVIGVGLLLLNFWWDRRQEKAAERAAAASPASADEPTDG